MNEKTNKETLSLKWVKEFINLEVYKLSVESMYPDKYLEVVEMDKQVRDIVSYLDDNDAEDVSDLIITEFEFASSIPVFRQKLTEAINFLRSRDLYDESMLEDSYVKLVHLVENSKLDISNINHLYPASTWADKSDLYKQIILFFRQGFFAEIIFGYHGIGSFRLHEPYRRQFFSIDKSITNKNKPNGKKIIDTDNYKVMDYQYEFLDTYRYDDKSSYEFINTLSIEIDLETSLGGSEFEYLMQSIRKHIITAQYQNRTHGLICAESLSDYEKAGNIEELEGITLNDYTKNTTKIINLKNINGVVSYIAALILIKGRRDHMDSEKSESKVEDDLIDVSEGLREYLKNADNLHEHHPLAKKGEGDKVEGIKKTSADGLAEPTIKQKKAEMLKAVEAVCELIRQGHDAYIPTAKLRAK
jgi:hypothetical protein